MGEMFPQVRAKPTACWADGEIEARAGGDLPEGLLAIGEGGKNSD